MSTRDRRQAERQNRTCPPGGALAGVVALLVALPFSFGWTSDARADPIRYTLEAMVGTFDNGDPGGLQGVQVEIVYEFDASTADSSTTAFVDGEGNSATNRNYFNGFVDINSTTAALTVAGSSYPGTVVTNWQFRNASGPNPFTTDAVRFPTVTFDVAGNEISYPGFTVEFAPAFVSQAAPFEFDADDYAALQLPLLSYVDPSSSAPLLDGQLRAEFILLDEDGDGLADADDACPASDLAATVVIDGCDSSVTNALDGDGCTISDLVADVAAAALNHGGFVSGVAHLLNDLKKAGVIAGSGKGTIQRCAAQADLP
jgi:hypothetical protein